MAADTVRGFTLLLLAAFLTISVATKTATKSEIGSKKILVLLPSAVRSHHNVFSALTDELLNRGHHVTIVSSILQKRKHPNLREILIRDPFGDIVKNMTQSVFRNDIMSIVRDILQPGVAGPMVPMTVFESPEALALKDEKFDLVIIEIWIYQDALLGFAHHFGCPSMALNPMGYTYHINYFTGGSANPGYVPNQFTATVPPETFSERLRSTLTSFLWMLTYLFQYYPAINAQLHKAFPNAPPVQELVRNVTLTLVNNNNALMPAVPLAPSVIEVGGIHIKPGKPLPADLKKWMEESEAGIVYFSLGSLVRVDLIPEEKQRAIFAALGKLKQRVLMKWTDEIPAHSPANVRFEKWLPQQEVLAHPNIKFFITHGGLLSTQESVYHGVPIVGLPVYGDQFINMDMATKRGFAIQVPLFRLTNDSLDAALNEIINNPRYREKAKELSLLFRLDPIPPLEKAVYYTEQLIKLGSFKHLQPNSINLHWYQCILLDVVAVIVITLYAIYRVMCYMCSIILGLCRKTTKPKKD